MTGHFTFFNLKNNLSKEITASLIRITRDERGHSLNLCKCERNPAWFYNTKKKEPKTNTLYTDQPRMGKIVINKGKFQTKGT